MGVSREIRDIHVGALCEKYGNNIAEAKQNSPLHMKYARSLLALLSLLASSTFFLSSSPSLYKVPHPCGSPDLIAHSRFQKYRHWISKCSFGKRARNSNRIREKNFHQDLLPSTKLTIENNNRAKINSKEMKLQSNSKLGERLCFVD